MFFSKKSLAFTPEDAAFIFSKLQPQLQNAAPTSFYPTRSGSGIVTADHLRNQLDDILNARQVLDPNGRVSLAQIAEFLDLDNAILLPLLDQAVLKAGAYQVNNVYFTVPELSRISTALNETLTKTPYISALEFGKSLKIDPVLVANTVASSSAIPLTDSENTWIISKSSFDSARSVLTNWFATQTSPVPITDIASSNDPLLKHQDIAKLFLKLLLPSLRQSDALHGIFRDPTGTQISNPSAPGSIFVPNSHLVSLQEGLIKSLMSDGVTETSPFSKAGISDIPAFLDSALGQENYLLLNGSVVLPKYIHQTATDIVNTLKSNGYVHLKNLSLLVSPENRNVVLLKALALVPEIDPLSNPVYVYGKKPEKSEKQDKSTPPTFLVTPDFYTTLEVESIDHINTIAKSQASRLTDFDALANSFLILHPDQPFDKTLVSALGTTGADTIFPEKVFLQNTLSKANVGGDDSSRKNLALTLPLQSHYNSALLAAARSIARPAIADRLYTTLLAARALAAVSKNDPDLATILRDDCLEQVAPQNITIEEMQDWVLRKIKEALYTTDTVSKDVDEEISRSAAKRWEKIIESLEKEVAALPKNPPSPTLTYICALLNFDKLVSSSNNTFAALPARPTSALRIAKYVERQGAGRALMVVLKAVVKKRSVADGVVDEMVKEAFGRGESKTDSIVPADATKDLKSKTGVPSTTAPVVSKDSEPLADVRPAAVAPIDAKPKTEVPSTIAPVDTLKDIKPLDDLKRSAPIAPVDTPKDLKPLDNLKPVPSTISPVDTPKDIKPKDTKPLEDTKQSSSIVPSAVAAIPAAVAAIPAAVVSAVPSSIVPKDESKPKNIKSLDDMKKPAPIEAEKDAKLVEDMKKSVPMASDIVPVSLPIAPIDTSTPKESNSLNDLMAPEPVAPFSAAPVHTSKSDLAPIDAPKDVKPKPDVPSTIAPVGAPKDAKPLDNLKPAPAAPSTIAPVDTSKAIKPKDTKPLEDAKPSSSIVPPAVAAIPAAVAALPAAVASAVPSSVIPKDDSKPKDVKPLDELKKSAPIETPKDVKPLDDLKKSAPIASDVVPVSLPIAPIDGSKPRETNPLSDLMAPGPVAPFSAVPVHTPKSDLAPIDTPKDVKPKVDVPSTIAPVGAPKDVKPLDNLKPAPVAPSTIASVDTSKDVKPLEDAKPATSIVPPAVAAIPAAVTAIPAAIASAVPSSVVPKDESKPKDIKPLDDLKPAPVAPIDSPKDVKPLNNSKPLTSIVPPAVAAIPAAVAAIPAAIASAVPSSVVPKDESKPKDVKPLDDLKKSAPVAPIDTPKPREANPLSDLMAPGPVAPFSAVPVHTPKSDLAPVNTPKDVKPKVDVSSTISPVGSPKDVKPLDNLKPTPVAPSTIAPVDTSKDIKPLEDVEPATSIVPPAVAAIPAAVAAIPAAIASVVPSSVVPKDDSKPKDVKSLDELKKSAPIEAPKDVKPLDDLKKSAPIASDVVPVSLPIAPIDGSKPRETNPLSDLMAPGPVAPFSAVPVHTPKSDLAPIDTPKDVKPKVDVPSTIAPVDTSKDVKPLDNLKPAPVAPSTIAPVDTSKAIKPKDTKPLEDAKPSSSTVPPAVAAIPAAVAAIPAAIASVVPKNESKSKDINPLDHMKPAPVAPIDSPNDFKPLNDSKPSTSTVPPAVAAIPSVVPTSIPKDIKPLEDSQTSAPIVPIVPIDTPKKDDLVKPKSDLGPNQISPSIIPPADTTKDNSVAPISDINFGSVAPFQVSPVEQVKKDADTAKPKDLGSIPTASSTRVPAEDSKKPSVLARSEPVYNPKNGIFRPVTDISFGSIEPFVIDEPKKEAVVKPNTDTPHSMAPVAAFKGTKPLSTLDTPSSSFPTPVTKQDTTVSEPKIDTNFNKIAPFTVAAAVSAQPLTALEKGIDSKPPATATLEPDVGFGPIAPSAVPHETEGSPSAGVRSIASHDGFAGPKEADSLTGLALSEKPSSLSRSEPANTSKSDIFRPVTDISFGSVEPFVIEEPKKGEASKSIVPLPTAPVENKGPEHLTSIDSGIDPKDNFKTSAPIEASKDISVPKDIKPLTDLKEPASSPSALIDTHKKDNEVAPISDINFGSVAPFVVDAPKKDHAAKVDTSSLISSSTSSPAAVPKTVTPFVDAKDDKPLDDSEPSTSIVAPVAAAVAVAASAVAISAPKDGFKPKDSPPLDDLKSAPITLKSNESNPLGDLMAPGPVAPFSAAPAHTPKNDSSPIGTSKDIKPLNDLIKSTPIVPVETKDVKPASDGPATFGPNVVSKPNENDSLDDLKSAPVAPIDASKDESKPLTSIVPPAVAAIPAAVTATPAAVASALPSSVVSKDESKPKDIKPLDDLKKSAPVAPIDTPKPRDANPLSDLMAPGPVAPFSAVPVHTPKSDLASIDAPKNVKPKTDVLSTIAPVDTSKDVKPLDNLKSAPVASIDASEDESKPSSSIIPPAVAAIPAAVAAIPAAIASVVPSSVVPKDESKPKDIKTLDDLKPAPVAPIDSPKDVKPLNNSKPLTSIVPPAVAAIPTAVAAIPAAVASALPSPVVPKDESKPKDFKPLDDLKKPAPVVPIDVPKSRESNPLSDLMAPGPVAPFSAVPVHTPKSDLASIDAPKDVKPKPDVPSTIAPVGAPKDVKPLDNSKSAAPVASSTIAPVDTPEDNKSLEDSKPSSSIVLPAVAAIPAAVAAIPAAIASAVPSSIAPKDESKPKDVKPLDDLKKSVPVAPIDTPKPRDANPLSDLMAPGPVAPFSAAPAHTPKNDSSPIGTSKDIKPLNDLIKSTPIVPVETKDVKPASDGPATFGPNVFSKPNENDSLDDLKSAPVAPIDASKDESKPLTSIVPPAVAAIPAAVAAIPAAIASVVPSSVVSKDESKSKDIKPLDDLKPAPVAPIDSPKDLKPLNDSKPSTSIVPPAVAAIPSVVPTSTPKDIEPLEDSQTSAPIVPIVPIDTPKKDDLVKPKPDLGPNQISPSIIPPADTTKDNPVAPISDINFGSVAPFQVSPVEQVKKDADTAKPKDLGSIPTASSTRVPAEDSKKPSVLARSEPVYNPKNGIFRPVTDISFGSIEPFVIDEPKKEAAVKPNTDTPRSIAPVVASKDMNKPKTDTPSAVTPSTATKDVNPLGGTAPPISSLPMVPPLVNLPETDDLSTKLSPSVKKEPIQALEPLSEIDAAPSVSEISKKAVTIAAGGAGLVAGGIAAVISKVVEPSVEDGPAKPVDSPSPLASDVIYEPLMKPSAAKEIEGLTPKDTTNKLITTDKSPLKDSKDIEPFSVPASNVSESVKIIDMPSIEETKNEIAKLKHDDLPDHSREPISDSDVEIVNMPSVEETKEEIAKFKHLDSKPLSNENKSVIRSASDSSDDFEVVSMPSVEETEEELQKASSVPKKQPLKDTIDDTIYAPLSEKPLEKGVTNVPVVEEKTEVIPKPIVADTQGLKPVSKDVVSNPLGSEVDSFESFTQIGELQTSKKPLVDSTSVSQSFIDKSEPILKDNEYLVDETEFETAAKTTGGGLIQGFPTKTEIGVSDDLKPTVTDSKTTPKAASPTSKPTLNPLSDVSKPSSGLVPVESKTTLDPDEYPVDEVEFESAAKKTGAGLIQGFPTESELASSEPLEYDTQPVDYKPVPGKTDVFEKSIPDSDVQKFVTDPSVEPVTEPENVDSLKNSALGINPIVDEPVIASDYAPTVATPLKYSKIDTQPVSDVAPKDIEPAPKPATKLNVFKKSIPEIGSDKPSTEDVPEVTPKYVEPKLTSDEDSKQHGPVSKAAAVVAGGAGLVAGGIAAVATKIANPKSEDDTVKPPTNANKDLSNSLSHKIEPVRKAETELPTDNSNFEPSPKSTVGVYNLPSVSEKTDIFAKPVSVPETASTKVTENTLPDIKSTTLDAATKPKPTEDKVFTPVFNDTPTLGRSISDLPVDKLDSKPVTKDIKECIPEPKLPDTRKPESTLEAPTDAPVLPKPVFGSIGKDSILKPLNSEAIIEKPATHPIADPALDSKFDAKPFFGSTVTESSPSTSSTKMDPVSNPKKSDVEPSVPQGKDVKSALLSGVDAVSTAVAAGAGLVVGGAAVAVNEAAKIVTPEKSSKSTLTTNTEMKDVKPKETDVKPSTQFHDALATDHPVNPVFEKLTFDSIAKDTTPAFDDYNDDPIITAVIDRTGNNALTKSEPHTDFDFEKPKQPVTGLSSEVKETPEFVAKPKSEPIVKKESPIEFAPTSEIDYDKTYAVGETLTPTLKEHPTGFASRNPFADPSSSFDRPAVKAQPGNKPNDKKSIQPFELSHSSMIIDTKNSSTEKSRQPIIDLTFDEPKKPLFDPNSEAFNFSSSSLAGDQDDKDIIDAYIGSSATSESIAKPNVKQISDHKPFSSSVPSTSAENSNFTANLNAVTIPQNFDHQPSQPQSEYTLDPKAKGTAADPIIVDYEEPAPKATVNVPVDDMEARQFGSKSEFAPIASTKPEANTADYDFNSDNQHESTPSFQLNTKPSFDFNYIVDDYTKESTTDFAEDLAQHSSVGNSFGRKYESLLGENPLSHEKERSLNPFESSGVPSSFDDSLLSKPLSGDHVSQPIPVLVEPTEQDHLVPTQSKSPETHSHMDALSSSPSSSKSGKGFNNINSMLIDTEDLPRHTPELAQQIERQMHLEHPHSTPVEPVLSNTSAKHSLKKKSSHRFSFNRH